MHTRLLNKPNHLHTTIVLAAIILLQGCAGLSSIYDYDYPLTSRSAKSKTTGLQIKLPQGWREVDANGQEFIDLWLVNKANDASISLTPLNTEMQINSRTETDLSIIKNLYLSFLKAGEGDLDIIREEYFAIGPNKYEAIEYNLNNGIKRDILFSRNDNYYILSAVSSGKYSNEKLFSIQNSVLTSIR